ncbi:5'-nucleotidase, lipoprotein e(P4) family [Tamlana sp. 2201CG12-4]|uniref:5'-nucleotidase, lipoprotein e(P4) family n=1 Tax=Tamlana sp. 2201CG12-4 TaxID=3112582 RepID=UPI002DBC352D|nr:5'-nucleotidase, lipoprotein e(P4) family [Tamlana sp. 2201CG12-4]MEC3908623.1 5'-nucleotidase, lipoprotein e(P4) family [Tamlana sp. 2201CG12-4]
MRYKFLKRNTKYKFLILIAICFLMFFNCSVTQSKGNSVLSSTIDNINIPIQEHTVQSVLWQQISSEYRALTYQAYNLAKLQLDDFTSKKGDGFQKPLAIITDIDETVLNNSPFLGKLIELKEEFSKERWAEWGKLIEAKSIPGACEFFTYAHSRGVEVFYISNRYESQLGETIKNLEKVGFPNADREHVLLKTDSGEKGSRRKKVQETHNVIMLLGDNLSDFLEVFEVNSTSTRNQHTDSLKTQFGKKFIVLPNPMYGDWEGRGVYKGTYNWTSKQKDSIRRSKLISY